MDGEAVSCLLALLAALPPADRLYPEMAADALGVLQARS